jgi:hypothetical protein
MSKNTKIALAVVICVMLALCCCTLIGSTLLVKESVALDPKEAASVASQISDFEVPAGYRIRNTISVLMTTTAFIADKHEQNAIWLAQVSMGNGVAPDNYLRQSVSSGRYKDVTWEVVETKPITIRGEETTLTVYSGTGPNNQKYHAWAAGFNGKGGKAILVILEPEEDWDEDAMQAFVASMH